MSGTKPGAEPHTDSHMHDTNYVQVGLLPKEKIKMMNELGIRNSTSMPIPTSLINLQKNDNPPEVFLNLPKAREEMKSRADLFAPLSFLSLQDHAHHHCGPLEFYYVPAAIVKEVEDAKRGRDGSLAEENKGISIKDFIANPQLLDRIVERSELYLDTSVNSHLAQSIKNSDLTEAERSRIDPMITGLHLGDDRVAQKFLRELYMNKDVFTGIGEITLNKELVDNMFTGHQGQASARTDSEAGFDMKKRTEPLIKLLEMAGVVGAPVVLHCDVDSLRSQIKDGMEAKKNASYSSCRPDQKPAATRAPDNLAGIKSLLTDPRVRDTDVVWAHAGGLGRFIQEGEGHTEELEKLLKECPKLKLDISWSEVARQLTQPNKVENWAKFIEKHSDRICFGSDTLAPKDTAQWNQTKELYAVLFKLISPEAKENVLNHTYENTFVAAREKVRSFEKTVLTQDFHDTLLNRRDGQPVTAEEVRDAKRQVEATQNPFSANPQTSPLLSRHGAGIV